MVSRSREVRSLRERVAKMVHVLHHYGDYGVESHTFGQHASIARVHIGFLESHKQPALSPDGTIGAFVEGEIYADDGEEPARLVLERYLREGENFVNRLNGSFTAVIHDAKHRKTVIANDRVGARPLFYGRSGDNFYFAPEIKALLTIDELGGEPNEKAIAHFLTNGCLMQDETFYKSIRQLSSASILVIENGEHRLRRYWRPLFEEPPKDRGTRYYLEELRELIDRSVARRIRSHRSQRIAVSLSGGYDSRCILGTALKHAISLPTISHGENPDQPDTDIAVARKIASAFGLPHKHYPLHRLDLIDNLERVVYLTDGLTDQVGNFCSGEHFVEAISKDHDVILRGDEFFGQVGGPFNEADALGLSHLRRLPRSYRSILTPESFHRLDGHCESDLAKLSAGCPLSSLVNRKDFFFLEERFLHMWDVCGYFHLLRHEVRTPFLDNDILDFVLRLPPKHRLYRSLFLRFVNTSFPEINKIGFSKMDNLVDWKTAFREEPALREFTYDKLRSAEDWSGGLLQTPAVEQFLDGFFKKNAQRRSPQLSGMLLSAMGLDSKVFQFDAAMPLRKQIPAIIKRRVGVSVRKSHPLYQVARPIFAKRELVSRAEPMDIIFRLLVLQSRHALFSGQKLQSRSDGIQPRTSTAMC